MGTSVLPDINALGLRAVKPEGECIYTGRARVHVV